MLPRDTHLPRASRTSSTGGSARTVCCCDSATLMLASDGKIQPLSRSSVPGRPASRSRKRRQVRDVAIVVLAELVEHIRSSAIHGRQRQTLLDRLVEPQPARHGREPLVDKNVDRVRVIDGEQPQLIEIRGFPQLLGHLEDIASVFRPQCFTGNAHVFLRRSRRCVRGVAGHDA